MTWAQLLEQWPLIEADLAEIGIDIGSAEIRKGRSWRWGIARIEGLRKAPPIGFVKVNGDTPDTYRYEPLYRYRIQQWEHEARGA